MEWLTQGQLSPFLSFLLIGLSAFTSFITAAFGAGGGLFLLVALASILPMSVVIPLHGLVQLGSNANRAILTIRHVDLSMLLYFSAGGVLGAACSSWFIGMLPLDLMKVVVGVFVLYSLWGIKVQVSQSSVFIRFLAGLTTTFLSMFIGASGPLVGSYLHVSGYQKLRYTATFSTCMSVQHGLKMWVYSAVGFVFWQWLPLTLSMIASGAIGTWLGLKLLDRLAAQTFRTILRVILTLLTLNLIWQGIAITV